MYLVSKLPKLKTTWTIEEERLDNTNSNALNVIFCSVDG
ncbi:hypothetical protein Gohar_019550 [Gossypium harknessii]|uniref:Uncharacterized protein n=1 Tax=Gossypium harknessii TaxID=34285 RepID=A0A7J9I7H3_9ROSI|nr:hypothetical protein [Gossypium harknessii]